jgi:predicted porin
VDAAGNAISRDSATIIDAQAQGVVADMPLGVYASFGRAAGQTAGAANIFNGGTETRSAFGILADRGVIPETLGVQFGLIRAKTGTLHATGGSNETDNAFTLGARYKFRQNVNMGVAYTKFSGTAYEAGGSLDATVPSTVTTPNTGTSLLNLTLVAAF